MISHSKGVKQINDGLLFTLSFPGGSVVKIPPANVGDVVGSLSQEDLLEKETTTHSSILAWRILWTEEPAGLQSVGSKRAEYD